MSQVIDLLTATGALLSNDHFVYTSGKHGPVYINKDILYTHTEKASEVGRMFAEKTKDLPIDVVAAPAVGGIVLSQWTAFHLSKLKGKEVLSVYTEKTPEKDQIFSRGYDMVIKGKNVLVIEDLVSTGSSVQKVVTSVRKAGGKVITVGVMVDRSPEDQKVTDETIGAPFFALDRFPVELYEANSCPLCQKKIPINTKVGHGKKFLQQNR